FLTIATILGTGILGLPVTISHAGLVPFLFSFLVGFFVQKCHVVQLESLKTGVAECIAGTEEEDDDDSENAQADTGLLQPDAVSLHDQSESLEPNLHLLGYLFLSRPMSHAFNFIILFQFISIGISYVLAGSEAYAALLNVSHIYVIPAFTWILTLAILVAHTVIQPITSLLTLLKGILLIVTGGRQPVEPVAVTFAVGSEVGLQSSSDFSQMGKPFLMGTVALGGIVNVMPLLYSRISHNRTQIMWFRRAVLGGLTTCTVLNILWCWAVLEIVPQTSTPERRLAAGTSPDPGTPLLHSNISLEASERAGEIATIPLTKIINERYKAYSWVAELIQVFVAISVTVSFLVMGSAMKHTIDGVVSSLWSSRMEELSKSWERRMANKQTLCSAKSVAKGFTSLLAFLAIFIVSVCDPQSFIIMLEKVVSFSLNTEVGLFIFIMLRESREDRFKHMVVPLPVGECVFSLSWLLPTYFLFAVTYDVLQTVADVAHYIAVYSHSQDTPPHNVTGGLTAANASILL
ncbi:hypothetical protein KUCAC02_022727, partial [Chaenocephalus aceratus]